MKRNIVKDSDILKISLFDATNRKTVACTEDVGFSSIQQCCDHFLIHADIHYYYTRCSMEVHIFNKTREWSGVYKLNGTKIC